MPERVRRAFNEAMSQARSLEKNGDQPAAWRALERAHILSQRWALPHVRAHAAMMGLAWRSGEFRELLGQVPRLALAAPASFLGKAPLGNSGRANVSMTTPQAIAPELAALLSEVGPQR